MPMNTKHLGAIAVAHAVSHFSNEGYYIFLPLGDNGGDTDMIVSNDGRTMQRVQCKYTASRHTASELRDPKNPVWQVNLRMMKSRLKGKARCIYTADSFDLLFVTTPNGDYLIDWNRLCEKEIPRTIRIGKKLAHTRLQPPANNPKG